MTKRKLDKIHGHDPWEIDAAALKAASEELDQASARNVVVIRWMQRGDLRPLSAALRNGGELSGAVRSSLADMIDKGLLTVKRGRRGRPKQPANNARNRITACMYELGIFDSKRSDDAFREIANMFGVSEQSVRQAVTKLRKRPKIL
jgi:hypothetical protein